MPTGLAKSTIHAPGAARRSTSAARSSTTGTVRSALARPPAPVVSWPRQPQRRGHGLVVQPGLLTADPELDQHRVRALERRRPVGGQRQPARPVAVVEDAPGEGADHLQPLRASGRAAPARTTGRSPLRRAIPETSSGVYVEPPPTTTTFIGTYLTPVSVTPWTKAFWAAKNSAMTGSMNSTVAAMVRFHCTWCCPRRLARATETVQALEFSPA